jgi:hypothetical protein
MDKDIIVGVVDRYRWEQIQHWANSIKKSGFTGHKALIVYNMDAETVKKLTAEGFMLIGCNQYDEATGFSHDNSLGSVMVDRFFHLYSFLNLLSEPVKNVIMTDVRDVIFQDDPSKWLDQNFFGNILVGSENLKYKDEPWGRNNLQQAFGQYFLETYGDNEIYCAGVIAGSRNAMKDLALNVWLICRGLNPHVPGGGGPDQAALNVLLQSEIYSLSTKFTNPSDAWVVHAGTSLPAIQAGSGGIGEAYRANPNINLPFVRSVDFTINNDMIYANGNKVTILHQWDRVPDWKRIVEEKYGDPN